MSNAEAARVGGQLPEHARMNYFNYFTEVEDAFIRRRGKHLLLSPMDWALIESWKEMGVPLHVVLRGIERAFDSHASRPRKRSVKSLMYCQEEVEAQFAEWLETQRGASASATKADDVETDAATAAEGHGLPFPRAVIAAHLADSRAALGRALEARRGSAGAEEVCEALARAASRLEDLASDFERAARPDAEQLENALSDLESLLDRALRSSLSADALEKLRAEAAEQLRPYRTRMERATYEQTLDNLMTKTLREVTRVPRLSLFYL